MFHFLLTVGAGYATYWLSMRMHGSDGYAVLFLAALLGTYYYAFQMIKTLFRLSAGASVVLMVAIYAGINLGLPMAREAGYLNVVAAWIPGAKPAPGKHFEGRDARNTSQADMDALMEDWE